MLKYENDFRIWRERLSELSWVTSDPASSLSDHVELLNTALDAVRAWRRMMDASTTFVTPSMLNCLRYLNGEATEVLNAWMKATLADPRRRPSDSTENEEWGHVAVLALTAISRLDGFKFTVDKMGDDLRLIEQALDGALRAGFSYHDFLCFSSNSAYMFCFSGNVQATPLSLVNVLWLCVKYGDNFVGGILATLDSWQKRGKLLEGIRDE